MDTSATLYAAYLIERGFGRPADPKRYPHDGVDYAFWAAKELRAYCETSRRLLTAADAAMDASFASWCRSRAAELAEMRREREAETQRQCEEMRALAANNARDLVNARPDERELHQLRTERLSEEYADVLDRRRLAELDEQIAAIEARVEGEPMRRVAA